MKEKNKKIDIDSFLKENAPAIDAEIARLFPRNIEKEWLEKALGKALFEYDPETATKSIAEPIWDFLDRGGKRWRPALMLLACEAVGGNSKKFFPFVSMPELIHEGCVTEDTVIWMADGTPKRIVDAKEGELVLSVDSDFCITEKRIEKFHDNGEKETLKIRTTHRSIGVTEQHPFLVVSKTQPLRYKITKNGRALLEQKLFEAGITISEFCDRISGEIETGMAPRALKNSFYGCHSCLVPKNVADYACALFSVQKSELFEEIRCSFAKANVFFEWKKAAELKEGDFVVIARKSFFGQSALPELKKFEKNCKDRLEIPQVFSTEFAQLCGFLVGDGCIQRNYNGGKVDFCIPKNGAGRKEYEQLIEKVFGAKPYLGKESVTCCSKALADMLIDLGLKGKCTEKQLPKWVFSLPLEHKKAFVKGYIDADGTVTKSGLTRFGCANRQLMGQFKFLFDGMGFLATNIFKKRISNEHFGEKAKKKETMLYCFGISQRKKILEEIGSEIAFYKTRLGMQAQRMVQLKFRDAIPNLPESFNREQLGFEKIKKIESGGIKKTFDLQIEETHNYISDGIITHNTIVADDIEDSSEQRRGKPCLHLLYGTDIALNDSNIMYFIPLILLYKNPLKLGAKTLLKIYDLYAEEMIRVSVGQATDIYWHKGKKFEISEGQYLQMCLCKTGVLASFSTKLGAILGKASQKQIDALAKFGESVGVAFQIQDDILNLIGTEFQKGKGVGEDIHEGKRTLLVLHALKKAGETDKERLMQILDSHPTEATAIEEAINIIRKYGAIDYARLRAKIIVQEAWEGIDKVLKKSAAKEKLRAFADYLIEREI